MIMDMIAVLVMISKKQIKFCFFIGENFFEKSIDFLVGTCYHIEVVAREQVIRPGVKNF